MSRWPSFGSPRSFFDRGISAAVTSSTGHANHVRMSRPWAEWPEKGAIAHAAGPYLDRDRTTTTVAPCPWKVGASVHLGVSLRFDMDGVMPHSHASPLLLLSCASCMCRGDMITINAYRQGKERIGSSCLANGLIQSNVRHWHTGTLAHWHWHTSTPAAVCVSGPINVVSESPRAMT